MMEHVILGILYLLKIRTWEHIELGRRFEPKAVRRALPKIPYEHDPISCLAYIIEIVPSGKIHIDPENHNFLVDTIWQGLC